VYEDEPNGADATSEVADWSANGAVAPKGPPADQGSTKYSAESLDELAANVTQPESVTVFVSAYCATASDSCVPVAPHDGRLLFGPAVLLQAANV
jgi:hypothetical protein